MDKEWKWFSKEEIISWGPENKKCRICNQIKKFDDFHKNKNCMFGVNTVCKKCRIPISKKQWTNKDIKKIIFDRAKTRATRKKIIFNISLEDIDIPKYCPILGIQLQYNSGDNSPSIDRINPKLGYIKGNVQIISNRANTIKNNASIDEIEKILHWMKSVK
jgi:hypothetical protein